MKTTSSPDVTDESAASNGGSVKQDGSAASSNPPTFIASKSDTKFKLTEEEVNYLDNLLAWQEMSARSTIRLGCEMPPNDPSSATGAGRKVTTTIWADNLTTR